MNTKSSQDNNRGFDVIPYILQWEPRTCRILWTFCSRVSILIVAVVCWEIWKNRKLWIHTKISQSNLWKCMWRRQWVLEPTFYVSFHPFHILVERSGGGCVMAGTQIVLAMVEPTWHRHLAPPALTPSAHWAIPPRYPTAPKLASWPLSQHWMWLFSSIQSPTIYLDPNQQRQFNYCHWKRMVGCL